MSEPEVVYIDVGDGASAIRERLRGAEEKRVLLVVPKGCPGLDNLVDLKLLGRQVINLGKEVALVTRDRELKELARGLGFRTFSSVRAGQRSKWRGSRLRAEDFLGASLRHGSARRGAVPASMGSETLRLGEKILFSFVFCAMLAFLGLILIVFVPTATVSLQPATYPVSTVITVEADPDLESTDFINLRVPARVVEIELVGNDEIATTAVRDEPDAKATGVVVFTNRRSEPTTVISGTIVTTSAGTTVRFRTVEVASLPPQVGGRARAPIEAVEPGPTGNVPAYSINRVEGPMDRQVNVINIAPTEGGGVSQVTYVTNADKEQLRDSLSQQLEREGYERLVEGLDEEESLPPESLLTIILSETYDKFPDEVADSLGLHMRALIRGTVIHREDAEMLGLRMLELEVREGFQLLDDETEFEIADFGNVAYDGTLTFQVRAQGATWVEIDTTDIRQGIRGKQVTEAQEYLARHLTSVEEPSVEVSPKWWGRVPWLPFRIAIRVVPGATSIG